MTVIDKKLPFDEMLLDDLNRDFKNSTLARSHYKQFSTWLSAQSDTYLSGVG